MSLRRARPRHLLARMVRLTSLFATLLHLANAQTSTTGAIAGHLVDRTGQPIHAAAVDILSVATGRHILLHTTHSGDFFATELPPAEYIVHIVSPGLETRELDHIIVEIGATARLRETLRPAGLSTEITVSAEEADDLDDPPSATSTAISAREIAHLPNDGRRWQSFALLTPQANPGSSSSEVGLLSFRGVAPTQNSSHIDGADDDQSFNAAPHGSGTDSGPETENETESQSGSGSSSRDFSSGSGAGRRPGAEYTFSQAAVREFRVVGQSYSALYGHASGGIIITGSKSGTATLHGSAFYLIRQSAWAAANPFAIATHYNAGLVTSSVVKPEDHRYQAGATVGGPLLATRLPHRLFYFYAFDAQRRQFPAISSPEDPGFFTLTPTQRALLANRGVTSAKINSALTYLDSLTGEVPRRSDQTINFLRLDGQLTSRHQLTLQYNRSRFDSPAGLRSAAVVNRATRSFGSQSINVDSALVRWTYSRNVALSNELRLLYNRDLHSEQPQTSLPQEPAIAPGGLAPEISIGPQGFLFGTPASVGRRASPDEHRIQLADVATVVRGRHLLQLGGDVSYVHDLTDALTNTAGTFHYDSGVTGGHAGGLVDWMTDFTFSVNAYPNGGCPSIQSAIHDFCFRSFSQTFGQQTTDFSTEEFAGFLQDRWTPSGTLSVTAGVRYEYELLPIPQHPNPAVDAIFSSRGATSIFPEDRNNVGPRIASSWQPLGPRHGTIRAAYGLYFGRLPGATIRSALTDTAVARSATRIRILPTTVTACPQVANQGFGYPCAFTAAPPAGVATTTSITVFDRRFRLPMVQQGSLSIDRDLGRVLNLSASYLVNIGHQLANSVDLNIAPSIANRTFQLVGGTAISGVRDGETFVLPAYSQRLNTSFGPVTAITSNANSTYNAVVLEARHRSRDGLEFHASWNWSKAIDFGQNISSVPRTDSQLDPFDIRYDKGLSALNFPHKIIANAIWQPAPYTRSNLSRHLTSGWLIAPVFIETSGRPYTYNIFGGTRLSGGLESINGSGGEVYLPTVGRNTLRLPDTCHLDLRLSRDLPLTEQLHLRLIAESFNLTNHVNYATITQRAFLVGAATNGITPLIFQDAAEVATEGLTTKPFAAFTSSSAPDSGERQIQFGLHLDF